MEKHQDLRNPRICQSPGHSQPKCVSYAEYTFSLVTDPSMSCVYLCTLPSDMIIKRTQPCLAKPHTPGLNRSCFCGRRANRKDNIVSELETKLSFLKLGGLDATGAAGEKSVIIVTKHRHCYPPSLRSFRSDDHNWFKVVKLSMIKFKELC